MNDRNLSPHEMFRRMAANHRPTHAFDAASMDFEAWKAEAYPVVLATLGKRPESVDPNPQFLYQWEDRGVTKACYLIDVAEHLAATVQVNTPGGLAGGDKRPAILCWHGHGPHGKEPVMGNGTGPIQAAIDEANYDYGHQMAAAGFVTYAIDWMGAGAHSDAKKPHFKSQAGGRDWCNLYYLHATMFGMTTLGMHLSQGAVATDFVCSLPQVDSANLGVMGLSGGGTMTLWTALTDQRFRAAEIICYSDLWARFGINDINYCGMQVAPGLYAAVDLPDLQGLLAPLPLLIDIGVHDTCFTPPGTFACFDKLSAIYKAAGASDQLYLDKFTGGHAWGGNESKNFFARYLNLKGS